MKQLQTQNLTLTLFRILLNIKKVWKRISGIYILPLFPFMLGLVTKIWFYEKVGYEIGGGKQLEEEASLSFWKKTLVFIYGYIWSNT